MNNTTAPISNTFAPEAYLADDFTSRDLPSTYRTHYDAFVDRLAATIEANYVRPEDIDDDLVEGLIIDMLNDAEIADYEYDVDDLGHALMIARPSAVIALQVAVYASFPNDDDPNAMPVIVTRIH